METQPLIPQVCVATAKLLGEFVAITAASKPTIKTSAMARSRVFKAFNFNPTTS